MAERRRFAQLVQDESDKIIYGDDLSKYGKEFQLKLAALLVKDRIFSGSILPILKNEYFSDAYLRVVTTCVKEYIDKYRSLPTIDNIKIILQNKNEKNIKVYESVLNEIDKVDLSDRDFVIDNARRFCFSKHSLSELAKMKLLLEEGKFEEAHRISIEAFKHSGLSSRKMYDIKEDYEKIFQDDVLHRPIGLPFDTFNKCSKGGPGNGNLIISVAFSNFGKCFAKGTEIRLYNKKNKLGKIEKVENIKTGDKILGHDFEPRLVTSTTTGEEEMFEIIQYNLKLNNYTVNKSHILVLYKKEVFDSYIGPELNKNNIITITVDKYNQLSDLEKKKLYGISKTMILNQYVYICHEIKIISKGIGSYYGFTLSKDNDRIFLLKDLTLAHNTAALTAYSRHANMLGKNVAFFSFEIGGVDILRRYIAGVVGIRQEDLRYNKEQVKNSIVDSTLGNFRLIEEKATSATVEQIRVDLEYLKSTGFFPDMICVDSLNQLKVRGFRPRDDNEKFEYLAEELRDLAKEYEVPLHTVFQSNRQGSNSELNDIMTIGKAIEPLQVADMLWTFSQTHQMEADGKCMVWLLKNRLGPKNIIIEAAYDPNMGTFKELREVPELLMMSDAAKNKVKETATNLREKLKSGIFDKKS